MTKEEALKAAERANALAVAAKNSHERQQHFSDARDYFALWQRLDAERA